MKASAPLLPLSSIYGAVTRARLAAYRRGWFKTTRLDVPVISVGNLTTGGTGKTPLVEWVCRALANEVKQGARKTPSGKNICVLTRGYGRVNPEAQVVVSNASKLLAKPRDAGDEPVLLARNLLGVAAVISNPNRIAAAHWAVENFGTEVFVLDDGFQHLRLTRDLDIVLIDATNPWGGGSLLPHGRLREPVSSLSRADCVVISRADQVNDLNSTATEIKRLAGAAPVFTSRMTVVGTRRLDGGSVDRQNLQTAPLAAFCGVANPASFFNTLRDEGFTPALRRTFADHHNYNQADVDALVSEAKQNGATGVITTAKDATKLSALDVELPCYILDIQIAIDSDDQLLELIRIACSRKLKS